MSEALRFPIRSDLLSTSVAVERVLVREQSEFQRIEIVETPAFGRVLLLDGHIQLTQLDEHAYHEALVQIPLLSMANPRRALVIGGGDGGALREIVRHPGIEHVDMVEIDARVVALCREHLPSVSAGAFDDPRVQLHIADAFPFAKEDREPYDLIVLDSTDTYEEETGEISEMLFTRTFYSDCLRLLSEGGMAVTQADNLVFCPYSLRAIREEFAAVFPTVGSYLAIVPSFGGFSGYCWASKGAAPGTRMPGLGSTLGLRYLGEATWAYAFQDHGFNLPETA